MWDKLTEFMGDKRKPDAGVVDKDSEFDAKVFLESCIADCRRKAKAADKIIGVAGVSTASSAIIAVAESPTQVRAMLCSGPLGLRLGAEKEGDEWVIRNIGALSSAAIIPLPPRVSPPFPATLVAALQGAELQALMDLASQTDS